MSDSDSSPKASSSSSSSDDEKRRLSAVAASGTPDPDSPGAARHHSSDESASSSDGVLVELPSSHDHDSRSSPGDPDGGILVGIDGSMHDNEGDRAEREDDFVDAPDQLGSTRSVHLGESLAMIEFGESSAVRLDDVVAECRKYKEEREVFGRLVVSLRQELDGLIDRQRNDDEVLERLRRMERDGGEERALSSPTPLYSMLDDCSKSVYRLKSVMNEQLNSEATIRELHALLYAKDREIEDLSAKVAESLVSRDVVVSYLSSVRDVHTECLRESYDEVVGRLSASLVSVVGQENNAFLGLDTDGISLVEKQTLVLIEKHERVLSEIQQLGQCLAEVRADFMITEVNEPNYVFSITRDELLESKRKEIYYLEKMNQLEEENRKLFEEVDRMKRILVEVNAETSKTKAELELAENKLAMAKEKLSIAVTKGKSLVQHRDSLKQSLAEKSSELEKCMLELQQKSETLVASESRYKEVKQSFEEKTRDLEKFMLELQQKSEALLTVEARVEELKQSLEDKTGELNKCLEELQLKSAALVAAEASKEELNKTNDLLNSLQESLSHRERIIGEIEKVVSLADSPWDMLSMDVVGRVKWLVDQKRISEGISLESRKIKDALSSIDLPEDISSMDVESQIDWLGKSLSQAGKSLSQAKDDTVKLQGEISSYHIALEAHETELSETRKEIDRLATSLLEEKRGKDSLQDEMTDLRSKYEEISEKLSLVSKEKDGLMKVLLEISGSTLADESFVDTDLMIEKCMEKVKERSKTAPIETEKFERMQSLLYVRDQELELCEKLLEEDLVDRSEITSLTNELARTSKVVLILRNEKESLQKELERSEEKSSLLREKLSMAVKKGKGLVLEREGFKISLDEKNSEIEKLKHELQLQDSAVIEYKEQLKSLSAYPEQFQKLEADIVSFKDQRDEFELILLESNSKLQKLMDSIQCIALPTETVYEEPVEKLKWIADHLHESEVAKARIEKELEKVKEEAMLQASKLEDAAAAIQLLDSELSEAKKNISVIFEEKKDIQLVKTSLEQELEKMKEEGQKQGSKLEHAYATIKSLEDSLSWADDSKTSLEQELDKMKEEGQKQDSKLEHAYATIRSLEDSLSQADNSLSLLEAAKNEIEFRSKQDLSALNAKLAECMEESAQSSGSLENQSVEVTRNLEHLQVLMKDESLFSLITEEFQTKIESLRNMGLLIQDMHEQFVAKGLHTHLGPEYPDFAKLCTLPNFEDYTNDRIVQSGTSAADPDGIPSFAKVVDGFHARAKLVKDRFTGLSKYMDDHIAVSFQALHAMRDEFIHMLELSASLKLNANNLEAHKQAQGIEMDSLQKQMGKLLSACTDATRALHDFCDLFELDSNAKQHEYNLDLQSKEFCGAQVKEGDASIYVTAAETLSNSAKEFRIGYQQLANSKRMWIASIDDLEEKLKQAELTAETASQDKHLNQERISTLEVDLEALQNVCNGLRSDIEDYKAKEEMLRKKEAEFISSKRTLIAEDTDDKLFSDDQMKTLVDKVNKLEFPFKTSEAEIEEVHFSSPIEKLFYIVDNISELWHRIETMVIEKEDMDLVLASHVHEIENLKKDAATLSSTLQDSESKKAELADLKSGLERIIQTFGGIDTFEDNKSVAAKDLLPILEKLMKASSMEYGNANSRVQEMASKLLAKENVIDELSEKIKLLEDSIDSRLMQPDTVKERTVFEASTAMGSEISEIEDAGALTKNTPPVPPAAHSRTTRKGSTDHLVLSIDPESEQLITAQEIDDKGHVFKSLNTSGIIPKQGKLIADRIDGIWVSGGRMLMSRPRARLGLIAYWLLLHLWVLGTIL